MTTGGGSVSTELTRDEIRETVLHAFGVRLCRWQLEAVVYQLQGRHVVAIAPTGLGKTLPFIVPLLFQRNLLLIIITPLNLLGTQQRRKLESLNIPAIALNAQTLTPEAVKTLHAMRYGAVILSPELAMNSAVMIKFWEKIRSMSMLVRLVIDEAHLMLAWAGFRKLYNNLSTLKHFLPARTDYYLTSATLPNSHLNTIFNNLALLRSNFSIIRRSNDRFNLSYVVRPMSHTKKSKGDLLFLFPDSSAPATDPAPFIIYVQSKADAEQIYDQLLESRSWLKGRIAYIHAEMENGWRDNVVEKFKCGDLIGLIGTDAVGLGLDVPNIKVVLQYGTIGLDLDTYLQRCGRGGRDMCEISVLCLLFVESEFTDTCRNVKAQKRTAATEGATRKKARNDDSGSSHAESQQQSSLNGSQNQTHDSDPHCEEEASPDSQPRDTPTANLNSRKTQRLQSKTTRQAPYIDPFLDDFVNAGLPGRPTDRRSAIDKLYENSKLGVPPKCCERCDPRDPILCCDICKPDDFKWVDDRLSKLRVIKEPRRPKQISVEKYDRTEEDKQLYKTLVKWQEDLGSRFFGSKSPFCGGDYLFPHKVIQRLVDLIHEGVTDRAIMARQCPWSLWDTLGDELYALLAPFFRQQPISTPQASRSTTVKCSVCKQSGHNKRSCSQRQQLREAEKENMTSASSSNNPILALLPLSSRARAANVSD